MVDGWWLDVVDACATVGRECRGSVSWRSPWGRGARGPAGHCRRQFSPRLDQRRACLFPGPAFAWKKTRADQAEGLHDDAPSFCPSTHVTVGVTWPDSTPTTRLAKSSHEAGTQAGRARCFCSAAGPKLCRRSIYEYVSMAGQHRTSERIIESITIDVWPLAAP